MKDVKNLKLERTQIIQTVGPQETVNAICNWINEQPETFSSIGIAAFGPLNLDKKSPAYGSVTSTPKVSWQNFPLLKQVLAGISPSKKTSTFRVAFDTDCNILAKFELQNGAHSVTDNLAYITVGTGVGVGFVINGKGIHGLIHPEGGHVSVPILAQEKDKYNFEGVCPFHGSCVEGLCTNVAIAKRLGLESVDKVPELPDDHEIWDMLGNYLGTMIANLTLTLSLEKVVIGGGVLNRGEVLLSKIRQHFTKRINKYLIHEKFEEEALKSYIVRSKFENELGLVSSAAVGSTGEVWGALPSWLEQHKSTAESMLNTAKDLKEKKDEIQLDLIKKAIQPMFAKFDLDKDGCLDREECQNIVKSALDNLGYKDSFNAEVFNKAWEINGL